MKRILFLASFLFVAVMVSHAQQDAQFSYYMYNMQYYNPAYSGVENLTKVTLLHRSQWSLYQSDFGDGGAPSSEVFSISSPIHRIKGGAGAHVVYDRLGPESNVEVQGSFAYHLGIKQSKLTVGFRTGFISKTLDYSKYRPIDDDDPVLLNGTESQIRPDLAAGIFYLNEKYYAGVSFNHLLKSTFDFGIDESRNALSNHMFLTSGFYNDISNAARLHTSMLLQTDFKQYNVTIASIMTVMERNKEKMWGGITLRQSEDIGLLLGYNFLKEKTLKFGYSFGYIIKDQAAKQPTSHEFILMYELPAIGTPNPKAQRDPRMK